jgi:uncharacterized protein YgbK (DUF1537 family)
VPQNKYNDLGVEPAGPFIRIFDAETDEDIRCIGAVLKQSDQLYALAGCAGFAEILPGLLELKSKEIAWHNDSGAMLIVTGSVNQITIDQINIAVNLGFHLVTLTAQQKLDSAYPESEECGNFVGTVICQLERYGKVIMNSINNRGQIEDSERFACGNAVQPEQMRGRIADNIGRITKKILHQTKIGTLVVFGGDTLISVLRYLECHGIYPISEIAPGVVAARIVSPAGSLNIITKSGGLGTKNVVGLIDEFVCKNL